MAGSAGFPTPPWLQELADQRGTRVVPGWTEPDAARGGVARRRWVDDGSEAGRIRTLRLEDDAGQAGCDAAVLFSPGCQGPPSLVHGGAILSAFHHVLSAASEGALRTLSVRFRRPLPLTPEGCLCRLAATRQAEQPAELTAELLQEGEVIATAATSFTGQAEGEPEPEALPSTWEQAAAHAASAPPHVPLEAEAVSTLSVELLPPAGSGWALDAEDGPAVGGADHNAASAGLSSFVKGAPHLPVLHYLWHADSRRFRGVYGLSRWTCAAQGDGESAAIAAGGAVSTAVDDAMT